MEQNKYCLVATSNSTVFAGSLVERIAKEVTLINARELITQQPILNLAVTGRTGAKSKNDLFTSTVKSIIVMDVTMIIECTAKAQLSIESAE